MSLICTQIRCILRWKSWLSGGVNKYSWKFAKWDRSDSTSKKKITTPRGLFSTAEKEEENIHLQTERVYRRDEPRGDLLSLLLRGVQLLRGPEPLLWVSFGFRFPLDHLEPLHLLKTFIITYHITTTYSLNGFCCSVLV